MEDNLINSEIVTEDIISLREKWFRAVSDMGAEKFFSSPQEDAKRAREAMAIYFFVAGLSKGNGIYYQVRQPKQDPPDFQLIRWGETIPILENFELVEIPLRFKEFEEMKVTVQNKLAHGYPRNYRLLIFVNHEKSREWINLLHKELDNHSFAAIYTVSMLYGDSRYYSMVNQLRPFPAKSIQVLLGEGNTVSSVLPIYIQGESIQGGTRVRFSPELLKKFMKWKIERMRSQNNPN